MTRIHSQDEYEGMLEESYPNHKQFSFPKLRGQDNRAAGIGVFVRKQIMSAMHVVSAEAAKGKIKEEQQQSEFQQDK